MIAVAEHPYFERTLFARFDGGGFVLAGRVALVFHLGLMFSFTYYEESSDDHRHATRQSFSLTQNQETLLAMSR